MARFVHWVLHHPVRLLNGALTLKTLSQSQIDEAQAIINGTKSGTYELRDIYGGLWRAIQSPTSFGMKFKATVVAGLLSNIKIHERKTNNHHTYEVLEK